MTQMNSLSYRKAAVESASPAGLVILLCDTLVGDIQRAMEAMRSGDIESRCRQMQHAFQVLLQLEVMLDKEKGGQAVQELARFYGFIRAKLLEAQFKQSVEILKSQLALILELRSAWQAVDAKADRAVSPPNVAYAAGTEPAGATSWSA